MFQSPAALRPQPSEFTRKCEKNLALSDDFKTGFFQYSKNIEILE
jgi:hypothetical protein